VKRLRELEAENAKLCESLAELHAVTDAWLAATRPR